MFTYHGSWVNAHLAKRLNRFLNMEAGVGAFIQEKAQVGAFSAIVKLLESSFLALHITEREQ